MALEAHVLGLQCLRCHTRFQEPRLFTGCPHCRAQGVAVNLTVEYDLSPLAGVTPDTFGTATRGLWRFRHLLPVRAASPVTLGEGVTPPVGSNPWGVEGYKTIAYEVAEDLGWTAPDVVVVPSAYSDGLYGIWKGWTELQALGLVKHAPRMIAAEPFGPLAHALERGLPAPEPVDAPAPSVAFSIASRYGTWQGLAALRESGGAGVRLTDEGVLEAQRALAREEGLYVEPSAAASLTAVIQLAARGAPDAQRTH